MREDIESKSKKRNDLKPDEADSLFVIYSFV